MKQAVSETKVIGDETLPDLVEIDSETPDYNLGGNRLNNKMPAAVESGAERCVMGKMRKRKFQEIVAKLKRSKPTPLMTKRMKIRNLQHKRRTLGVIPFARYPVLQENTIFQFCHNGSIKMFYDQSKEEVQKEKILEVAKPEVMRVVFDKRLSQLDFDLLLKGIGENPVEFEIEGSKHYFSAGLSVVSDLPKPACCNETNRTASPVSRDDAVIDIETLMSEEQHVNDNQVMTSEVQDVWETVIRDDKFQPKVVVKDIRSSSDWDTFISKERETNSSSDEIGSLTLQISRVESLHDSVSQEGDISTEDELQQSSPEMKQGNDNKVHMENSVFPETSRSREAEVNARRQTEHLNISDLDEPDDTPNNKPSAQTEIRTVWCREPGDGFLSMETGKNTLKESSAMNDDCSKATEKIAGSVSFSKGNCKSLELPLERVVVNKQYSDSSSNSPVIDVAQLESWGTQLSLLRDLKKHDSSEKSSIVLSKLSQVRKELGRVDCAVTDRDDDHSTLDLFIDENDVNAENIVRSSKATESYVHRTDEWRENRNRSKDVTMVRSFGPCSSKYSHLLHKQRCRAPSRLFRCSRSRNKRVKDSYCKTEKRRHQSTKRSLSRHGGFRSSKKKISKSEPLSHSLTRHRIHGARVDSTRLSADGDSYVKAPTIRERSKSNSVEGNHLSETKENVGKLKARRNSEGCSVTKHTKKKDSNCDSDVVNAEFKSAKKDDSLSELKDSLKKTEVGRLDIAEQTVEPGLCSDKVKQIEDSNIEAPVEVTSSAEYLKIHTETEQRGTEKEMGEVNEKWVETCERLFLGRSGKEGSPLFDGYRNLSESSAAADPSEWLNKLIRINTKRKDTNSSTPVKELSVKRDEANGEERDNSIADGLAGERFLSKPLLNTSTKDSASSQSKESVPLSADTCTMDRSDFNMSREELTNLVSRALTILKPADALVTTTEKSQSQLDNAGSGQNRLSAKYIRRKRKSISTSCALDSCESSVPAKLWGSKSLEEMHQNVNCQEPVVFSLPKYQANNTQALVLTNTSPESELRVCSSQEVDVLRSPNAQRSTPNMDPSVQSRDPRLRRLSLSPRAESGSDLENVFRSPVPTDSPARESPAVSTVDVDNTIKPKNRISKLWEASLSAPKALGNESVALRELKVKEKRTEPGPIRRKSSSDRLERKLSVDERYANYSPWKRKLHLLHIPECVCYQNLEQQSDSKDPRLSRKRVVHNSEFGKRATKHCRSIPLEQIKKATQNRIHSSGDTKGISNVAVEDNKRNLTSKRDKPDDDPQRANITALNKSDNGECLTDGETVKPSLPSHSSSIDCPALKGSTPKASNAAVAWTSILTQTQIPIDDIGVCCAAARSAMEEVWQLGTDEYQSLNEEMTYLMNKRIQTIEDSLMFSDPTKGLDQQRRLKLIASSDISDSVIKELQIEEEMRVIKEKNHQMRQQLDDTLKSKSLPDSAIKDLRFQIDIRDIKYEKYNKDLEDLGRFYKSSVVEVLPDMFRLNQEKNKFISSEGNMLFLVSPLKEVDCKRLLGLVEEIKEYTKVIENPSSACEDQEHARLRLGWLHGERKETLCQLCLNMYRSKQVLLQRFLDKLSWCK